MKIYIAAFDARHVAEYHKLFPEYQSNILISYGSPASKGLNFLLKKFRDKIGSIILDAGTYELNNSKKSSSPMALTLAAYKIYLKRFGHLFDHYFNFDEDFSTDGMITNLCNLNELKEAGLSPIPVVHDIYGDEIDIFLNNGYKYVALGSTQIKSRHHLAHAMKKFTNTGVKVHLFGNTSFDFLANFPIYSCDSARWAHSTKNGIINFWNHEKPESNKTERIFLDRFPGTVKGKSVLSCKAYEPFVKMVHDKIGIDIITLLSSWDYQDIVNIYYMMELETAINQIHREKGFYTAE